MYSGCCNENTFLLLFYIFWAVISYNFLTQWRLQNLNNKYNNYNTITIKLSIHYIQSFHSIQATGYFSPSVLCAYATTSRAGLKQHYRVAINSARIPSLGECSARSARALRRRTGLWRPYLEWSDYACVGTNISVDYKVLNSARYRKQFCERLGCGDCTANFEILYGMFAKIVTVWFHNSPYNVNCIIH